MKEAMRLLAGGQGRDPTNLSGHDDWHTPPIYLDAARDVLGRIECDPASSDEAQKTVQAEHYFTPAIDGLKQSWSRSVWLNPPYRMPAVEQFTRKLLAEIHAGTTTQAILLTNNSTDTKWWHAAAELSAAVCFVRGRIHFSGADGAPLQGQSLLYFGPDAETFCKRFAEFGRCWKSGSQAGRGTAGGTEAI